MSVDIMLFLGAIRGVADIAKGLKSAHDAQTVMEAQSQILEKLFSIQASALSLQQEHSAFIDEIANLKLKLKEFDDWKKEELYYELKQVNPGKFVYASKESKEGWHAAPWYCTNCWNLNQKSILQASSRDEYEAFYNCPRYKATSHYIFKDRPPNPPTQLDHWSNKLGF